MLKSKYYYSLLSECSVVYNGNGADSGAVIDSLSPYRAGSEVEVLNNTFTRTGYTFNSWNTDANGSGTSYDPGDTFNISENTTLYAQWTPISYEILFNKNDNSATGSMSAQTFRYDELKALTLNAFSKEGYSFSGWATSDNGSVEYADGASVINLSTQSGVINLFAKWIINTYTVTFNMLMHGDPIEPQTINYNSKVSEPTAPTAEGYTFGGWYKEAACTNAWNFNTDIVVGVLILYAKWTINSYTIAFDSNGGSAVSSITQNYGTAVATPSNPTKTGYTFSGWSPTVPSTMPASNMTCVAQWTAKTYGFEISARDADDSSLHTQIGTATYGSNTITGYTTPTRTGYDLIGYYRNNVLVVNVNGVLQPNITINSTPWTDSNENWIRDGVGSAQAEWSQQGVTYTATVASTTNCSIAIDNVTDGSKTFAAGASVTLITTTPATNYQLVGYNILPENSNSYRIDVGNAIIMPADNITITPILEVKLTMLGFGDNGMRCGVYDPNSLSITSTILNFTLQNDMSHEWGSFEITNNSPIEGYLNYPRAMKLSGNHSLVARDGSGTYGLPIYFALGLSENETTYSPWGFEVTETIDDTQTRVTIILGTSATITGASDTDSYKATTNAVYGTIILEYPTNIKCLVVQNS